MDITADPSSPYYFQRLLGEKLFIVKSIEEAHRLVRKPVVVCLPHYPKALKTLRYFSRGKAVLALCMRDVWRKPHLLARWYFYGQWGARLGARLTAVSLGPVEKSDRERAAVLALVSGSQCYGRRGAELLHEVMGG